jgi:hypothetical protein
MMLVYMIMGYCLPMITTMLLRDWWQHHRFAESTEES